MEFMFHSRGLRAGLPLKADSVNLANQEGNIRPKHSRKVFFPP